MSERPFPWKCPHCRRKAVERAEVSYAAQIDHDGRALGRLNARLAHGVLERGRGFLGLIRGSSHKLILASLRAG